MLGHIPHCFSAILIDATRDAPSDQMQDATSVGGAYVHVGLYTRRARDLCYCSWSSHLQLALD
jgi:hypothetical protein